MFVPHRVVKVDSNSVVLSRTANITWFYIPIYRFPLDLYITKPYSYCNLSLFWNWENHVHCNTVADAILFIERQLEFIEKANIVDCKITTFQTDLKRLLQKFQEHKGKSDIIISASSSSRGPYIFKDIKNACISHKNMEKICDCSICILNDLNKMDDYRIYYCPIEFNESD